MNSLLPILLVAGLACVYGASLNGLLCGPVCMMYCPFGNELNEKGCPLCKCKPNPDLVIMDMSTAAVEVATKPACPQVMCMIYCPQGNLLGDDGCPKCACN
ncbi:BPTI/Kunitz domain-containing protein 4-like [Argopecten irradians]|uniref:BPTI/Kunitz domain-containing protein 4-like n=1 Tax=Argopecten irradians TaxID=31199 RepID=UPI003713AAD6